MLRLMFCTMAAAAVAVLPGCGGGVDGPERVPVEGTVTYAGEPIQEGKIRFIPENGPVAVGQIENGRYKIDARGGVPVGDHRVAIEAFRPKPGAEPVDEELAQDFADMEAGDVLKEQFLPQQYSSPTDTTLRATVEAGSGPITKDFELE